MNKPVESAALVLASLVAVTGCIDDPSITDEELAMAESAVAVPACAAGTWCVEATPAGTGLTLHDVWAADANNVFAVGDGGTILRRSGGEWLAMPSGTTQSLRDVHGTSAADVWAVGMAGTVLHYNGTAWSKVTAGTATTNFDCVYAASATKIFMCGGSSIYRSTNGSTFTATSMTGSLFAISGVSANEVYVTGENSYVRKWNGTTWSTVNPGAGTPTYFSILAVGAGDVWVSDYMPTKETMHLVSNKWAAKGTSSAIFQAMDKGNGSDVWGAGASKVGRFNGTSWTMTTPFGTGASLWGVSAAGGHVFAVGANGLVGHYAY